MPFGQLYGRPMPLVFSALAVLDYVPGKYRE